MGKGLSYLKNWGIGINYCWNYGPSKLLLHFIEYRLDQLISKHTKIAVNSTIQYFEGCSRKKYLPKFWIFLVHPPQNGDPVKFLRNWTETNHLLVPNIFKLHEYQTFGLMEMHNMCKIWFANNIFSLWRWNKNYFSLFFKGFQFPEIAPDLRLRSWLYWILKEDFCVISLNILRAAILWDTVARIILKTSFDSFLKIC